MVTDSTFNALGAPVLVTFTNIIIKQSRPSGPPFARLERFSYLCSLGAAG